MRMYQKLLSLCLLACMLRCAMVPSAAQAEQAAQRAQQAQAAAAAPKPISAPVQEEKPVQPAPQPQQAPAAEEKVLEVTVRIHVTKAQLDGLGAYMRANGIKPERV